MLICSLCTNILLCDCLDTKTIHWCCWDGGGVRDKFLCCGGNLLTIHLHLLLSTRVNRFYYHSHQSLSCDGQGRNADALALYFGEDPARCPFEQGKLCIGHSSYLTDLWSCDFIEHWFGSNTPWYTHGLFVSGLSSVSQLGLMFINNIKVLRDCTWWGLGQFCWFGTA